MDRIGLFIRNFLALIMAFMLGFLCCAGPLFLGGYLAYSWVSLDKLDKWGIVSVNTDTYISDDPDVSLTKMTIKDLIEELKTLSEYENTFTIDTLIERYGLILPDSVDKVIPPGARNVPLSQLFSQSGADAVLDGTTFDYILQFLPSSFLSEPAREQLRYKSLRTATGGEFSVLLDGMRLGYLLGVNYERDVNGRYNIVYADAANPTILELLAPIELGKAYSSFKNGDGILGVLFVCLGDAEISGFVNCFAGSDAAEKYKDKKISDLIYFDKNSNAYALDFANVLNGIKLGTYLGYTPIYDTEDSSVIAGWLNGSEKLKGFDKIVADIDVGKIFENGFQFSDLFDGVYLGEALGYSKGAALPRENPESSIKYEWYTESVKDSGVYDKRVGSVEETMSNYLLSDIMSGKADMTVSSLLGDTTIADVFELTLTEYEVIDASGNIIYKTEDPTVPVTVKVWKDSDGNEADAVVSALANLQISEADAQIGSIKVGDILGYSYCNGAWYDKTPSGDKYMLTSADGLTRHIADLTVNELGNSELVDEKIRNIEIGEAVGYNKVDGVWCDAEGNPATGIMKCIASKTIKQLDNSITDEITVADVMNYQKVGDKWYDGEKPVEGILAAIADSYISNIDKDIDALKFGKIMGWTEKTVGENTVWYTDAECTVPATGIMKYFCGFTVNEMTDSTKVQNTVKNIVVGDAMGYTKIGDKWYDETGAEVVGIMKTVADSTISNISVTVDGAKIGDIMKYNYDESTSWWYNGEILPENKVSPLINKISGSTVGNLGTTMDALKVSDMFTEDERSDGFLSLLDPDTQLNNLAASVNDTFETTTMGTYVDKGIITLSDSAKDALAQIDMARSMPEGYWRTLGINDFINYIIGT